MSIMEKNLPVADSIASGDKVRIVTSGGSSKQIDASAIGGGGGIMKCSATYDENTGVATLDKTCNEIADAVSNGILPLLIEEDDLNCGIYVLGGITVDTCNDMEYYIATFVEAGYSELFYATSIDEQMTTTNPCG